MDFEIGIGNLLSDDLFHFLLKDFLAVFGCFIMRGPGVLFGWIWELGSVILDLNLD